MKASNELIKLPQLSATMREMSAEMMKVRPRALEDEADEEVDKVLYELTDGKLGQAGQVEDSLPAPVAQEEDVNTEAEMQRMQRELQDLLTG
jgi:charged multivesicular body protein 3